MNNKRVCVVLGLLAGVVSLSACGDGSANLYTQASNAEASAVAVLCECFEVVGADSEAECVADFGDDATPAEQACVEGVYETYRAEALEHTRCQLGVFDDAVDCLNDVAACDETAVEACFMAAGTGSDACPELPQAVDDAVEACFN